MTPSTRTVNSFLVSAFPLGSQEQSPNGHRANCSTERRALCSWRFGLTLPFMSSSPSVGTASHRVSGPASCQFPCVASSVLQESSKAHQGWYMSSLTSALGWRPEKSLLDLRYFTKHIFPQNKILTNILCQLCFIFQEHGNNGELFYVTKFHV